MTGRDLSGFVDGLAARRGDAPALVHAGRPISFARLAEESRRVAGGLAALGVETGDRVAIWLPNVPAWPVLHFALARLGAVAVAVNTRFRSSEVADIVGRSGARVLVLWPGFKGIDFLAILGDADPAALDRLEALVFYDEGETPAANPLRIESIPYNLLTSHMALGRDAGDAEAGTLIFTTSGTTSAPKFVLHPQRSLVDHARDVALAFGYDRDDAVMLQALPLCGTFGHAQLMGALAAGRPSVLQPAFSGDAAAHAVRDHRVTNLNATDEMFVRLFEAAQVGDLETLRGGGFAGFNPAAGDVVAMGDAAGVTVHGLYGMSEVQALYARQPEDAPPGRRRLGGGRPVTDGAVARAVDPDGGTVLPHGENGELQLTGPSLMRGYFGDAAATAAAITADGYFRTGDLGHSTDDGGFVFVTRMGDMLRLGGFLVGPAEIEAHLERHPAVAAAQVVGFDGAVGPAAAAFVVPAPGAGFDPAALAEHCRRGLAKFKVPAAFYALDAFPVTDSPNGAKIQRAKLRRLAAERGGGAAK